MSSFTPKADIDRQLGNVRQLPIAEAFSFVLAKLLFN